jgi:hypothetical protein
MRRDTNAFRPDCAARFHQILRYLNSTQRPYNTLRDLTERQYCMNIRFNLAVKPNGIQRRDAMQPTRDSAASHDMNVM